MTAAGAVTPTAAGKRAAAERSSVQAESKPAEAPIEAPAERLSPYSDPWWPVHLFFSSKFSVHRVLGLVYLLQYAASWWLYSTDFPAFLASPLPWSLPLNGVLQAVTATYYFSFLPRKADPGYYSDKSALSYAFVAENIFFSSLLLFQALYMTPGGYASLRRGLVFEAFFVFLPYTARPLFPKTSFRDSINSARNKSAANFTFFYVGTWITKIFYLWAKWFIGFYMNYARFMGRIGEGELRAVFEVLLWSGFATTISMFLHTLKFKGYIGPRTSFGLYMASYLATFLGIVKLGGVFTSSPGLVALAAGGMVLNFAPTWLGHAFQLAALVVLSAVRAGSLTLPFPL